MSYSSLLFYTFDTRIPQKTIPASHSTASAATWGTVPAVYWWEGLVGQLFFSAEYKIDGVMDDENNELACVLWEQRELENVAFATHCNLKAAWRRAKCFGQIYMACSCAQTAIC